MNITDFNMPTEHPWEMLSCYEHAMEKEQLLAYMLAECIEAGDLFYSVKLKKRHPTMVEEALLEEAGGGYCLTKKSIGLLWVYYGKE